MKRRSFFAAVTSAVALLVFPFKAKASIPSTLNDSRSQCEKEGVWVYRRLPKEDFDQDLDQCLRRNKKRERLAWADLKTGDHIVVVRVNPKTGKIYHAQAAEVTSEPFASKVQFVSLHDPMDIEVRTDVPTIYCNELHTIYSDPDFETRRCLKWEKM